MRKKGKETNVTTLIHIPTFYPANYTYTFVQLATINLRTKTRTGASVVAKYSRHRQISAVRLYLSPDFSRQITLFWCLMRYASGRGRQGWEAACGSRHDKIFGRVSRDLYAKCTQIKQSPRSDNDNAAAFVFYPPFHPFPLPLSATATQPPRVFWWQWPLVTAGGSQLPLLCQGEPFWQSEGGSPPEN